MARLLTRTVTNALPSQLRGWLDRNSRILGGALAAGVLIAGVLLIRSYWQNVQTVRAQEDLAQALALPDAQQIEHLERLSRQYAGLQAAAEIRYRLGCAHLRAGQWETAEGIFRQVVQDAPQSAWAVPAATAGHGLAAERAQREKESRRVRDLSSQADAQRRFAASPPDPRHAALSVPHRPDAAGEPADRFSGIEKP